MTTKPKDQIPVSLKQNGATDPGPQWGSDILVDVLEQCGIEYVAIVPGSSSRGLHDSIINYHQNSKPEMLLCLHEAAVVAIAHGYAKVAERPMGAAVYANVGIMNSAMAIYNSYADRVPMIILGCNGSIDGAKRRPWIDWVHTTADTGALIRQYVKFDDSPMSLQPAIEGIFSCYQKTSTKPSAPTYIRLDTGFLEEQIGPEKYKFPGHLPEMVSDISANRASLDYVRQKLRDSRRPVILFGRSGRSEDSWKQRQLFIESYGITVLTDIKQPSALPTGRRWNPCPASLHNEPAAIKLLQRADLIVSLDWVDLAGTLKSAFPEPGEQRPHLVHTQIRLLMISCLETAHGAKGSEERWWFESLIRPFPEEHMSFDYITMRRLARAVNTVINPDESCLIRLPIAWDGSDLDVRHPLAFLGMDGGAGVGSGPGMAVGAALALRDHHKHLLPVAILGDGDFFMGANALWTAARYRIPLLIIVANNISFYNDEIHQEKIARVRNRPVENKHVGIRIDDPEPDVGKMAESLGMATVGAQIRRAAELEKRLAEAVAEVKRGKGVVVDVRVVMD